MNHQPSKLPGGLGVGWTMVAVGGATLCMLGGVSVLAIAVKGAAGILTWYALEVAGEDLRRLQVAAAEAQQHDDHQRYYQLSAEVFAAAAGAAIFALASPPLALLLIPSLLLGMFAYHHLRRLQAAKLDAALAGAASAARASTR